jgi:3-oxoacyl-[acyl-carrier-protein] synthase II
VHACGLGIPKEDAAEIQAMQQVFNGSSSKVTVTSTKPITGFTGFAAGALDLILSTLALRNGVVPPMLNLKNPRAAVEFQLAQDKAITKPLYTAMTNTFGLNGQSVSVITHAYKESQ